MKFSVFSDGVTYLECCLTNCRYGKCVERVGECYEGEVVQDITMNGDDLVMRCCSVLDLLSKDGSSYHQPVQNAIIIFFSVENYISVDKSFSIENAFIEIFEYNCLILHAIASLNVL